jgi:putative oxidoreductase
MKSMRTLQPLSLLFLRLVLAWIFVYHGYPKLVHSTEAMRQSFMAHGLPGYFVNIAAILECFGAGLLFLGLFTRPAALLLCIEMCVAIWKVHSLHGIMSVRDYEFPLSLAAASFLLGTVGAGTFSVDNIVFGEDGKRRRVAKSSKE